MDSQDRKALALWAADCAEHVLPHFEEERPEDTRPRRAIEAGRAWTRGEMKVSEVRAEACDAHAAAREAHSPRAVAAARAAGQAAGTAHVATHAPHAAAYAVKAASETTDTASASSAAEERNWQYRRIPEHLRPIVFPNQYVD